MVTTMPATIRRLNRRSSPVLHNRDTLVLWIGQSTQCLSLDENRRRAATTGDGRRRFVDGRRRFNAQRKTELNWTELNDRVQFSSVEFSIVFRCALGFKCRLVKDSGEILMAAWCTGVNLLPVGRVVGGRQARCDVINALAGLDTRRASGEPPSY